MTAHRRPFQVPTVCRVVVAVVTVMAMLAAFSGPAAADTVQRVIATGADTINLSSTAAGSTTVSYKISADKLGGLNGCDAKDAVVTIVVPPRVTAQPQKLFFTGCDTSQPVILSSSDPGDYSIGVSVSDPDGSYDTSPASFTLHVVRANTAPKVTVGGVVSGSSYEKGSVPASSCNVNDAEDGASTFAATLSAITGPLSSYGLGSQTASCTKTDSGGLSGSDSKTYSIVDTRAPQLILPGDITKEATGPSGAAATYTPTAIDAVDPAPVVACTPDSGSTFALGTKPVTCSATDVAGNKAEGLFNVTVQDTTKPKLSLPADITKEATGPSGAAATYSASASDTVDGDIVPVCSPASGATFALGGTPVNCTATDSSTNSITAGFTVSVVDTSAPVLKVPAGVTVEATDSSGAVATFSASAVDLVDGPRVVACASPSGSTFPLGRTTVNCSASDTRNNPAYASFVVTVTDLTAPVLHLPANIEREATKPDGADVSFSTSASDLVDGDLPATCLPASGGTFNVATTTVACTATDAHGNKAAGSFTVTVKDTAPPTINDMPADQLLEATGPSGATATYTLPTAADVVDGGRDVSCTPGSGTVFGISTTTVTCSASDTRSNTVTRTFKIKVHDTTTPDVDVPDNIEAEATSAAGAVVTWTGVSATDIVSGAVSASCDATSGATFALGPHTVTCSATDGAGNTGSNTFTISVNDTKAPEVTVPDNMTKEATGPNGAVVTWTASAEDVVDGKNLKTDCVPPSGSTFPLGTQTVTCTSTDRARNTGSGAFGITVQDTTAPTLTVPGDTTLEATSAAGASSAYSTTATDLVDTNVMVSCSTPSGSTFPLGSPTTVTCTATDDYDNSTAKSFQVTVVDTTAPALTVPGTQTVEASSADGAVATYAASAHDLVNGAVTPQCSPISGSTFALGTTPVTCTAVDARGNSGTKTFTVKVQDSIAPSLVIPENMTVKATSAAGAAVTYTATASDLVDGAVAPTCTPASGSTFKPGTTTVSCTAADKAGNASAAKTFTVTVSFSHTGFLPPVDGNKVLNGMKAGSTAPIKWQVPNGTGGFISDLSIVSRTQSGVISCAPDATMDDLELYTTGNTTLRYDATSNQFIYNWQSPKSAGKCYTVQITLTDGSVLSAIFRLK